MKTKIPFLNKVTLVSSNCGEPLEIKSSSAGLGWDGVLVERGISPYFHPKDVVTPNFYFAIEMRNTFKWNIEKSGELFELVTEPGDIWINPPYTPFTHNIDVACDFLIVNISKERLYKHFNGNVPEEVEFLNNYNINDKTLEHLMYLLMFEVDNKGVNGANHLDGILDMFSNYFIEHFSNYNDIVRERTVSSVITMSDIELIDDYIDSNLEYSISIEELAEQVSLSKFYFLKEFKRLMFVTPYQYIVSRKIEEAKQRVTEGIDSMTKIAYDLGFSDSSHFTRTFKRVVGVTPKEYKK